MDSCPAQIYLQDVLQVNTPQYAHIPLAVYDTGEKISKRYDADYVLLEETPAKVIYYCLEFLGQEPPPELLRAEIDDLIQWGTANWKLHKVPARRQVQAPIQFQKRNEGI